MILHSQGSSLKEFPINDLPLYLGLKQRKKIHLLSALNVCIDDVRGSGMFSIHGSNERQEVS